MKTVIHAAGLFMSFAVPALNHAQTWEVFDMASAGLPSNRVQAIAHDLAGATWIGTDWGLCRYDGTAWEVFQSGNSGLPENDIRALACDGSGRMWIGLLSQGLVVLDGANWLHFTQDNSPLPADQVRNIAFASDGAAWLATTGGVVRTDLTEWDIYNDTDESHDGLVLPGTNIADIVIRPDGIACIGTLNAGFTYLTPSAVIVYTNAQDGLPDNTALGVAIDANGDRWLACPSGGLLRNFGDIQGGFWAQYITATSGIPGNALNDVVIDGADRKIVATQAAGVGILTGTDDEWQSYNIQNSGLPDNEVLCVSVEADETIWAGTAAGGAARWTQSTTVPGPGAVRAARVFPVPATRDLFIDLPEVIADGPVQWSVRDPGGRVLALGAWQGCGTKHLDISSYPPGTYALFVASDHWFHNIRFVAQ